MPTSGGAGLFLGLASAAIVGALAGFIYVTRPRPVPVAPIARSATQTKPVSRTAKRPVIPHTLPTPPVPVS